MPDRPGDIAGHVLVVDGPGRVRWARQRSPGPLPDGCFDVHTRFSGLSAGTDLSWVKGDHPALDATWDPELGLFTHGRPASGYPVPRFGYMQVGEVTASAATDVAPGDLVAMTYGHRTAHRVDPRTERVVGLPDGLDPILGIYAAQMGPICANGVLHAAAEVGGSGLGDGVRDRHVAVTGAGVVGLLTALFATHHGAATVVVVDPTPERRTAARSLGLEAADADGPDVAADLKRRWHHGPRDHGADVVFQCRGRSAALALALRLSRPQATVIDLAFYPGTATDLRLGEEYHHNGLGLRCAQIGRVPRSLTQTWDRNRLSAETFALLRVHGEKITRALITERVPLGDAPDHLLTMAAGRRHTGLQTVFTA